MAQYDLSVEVHPFFLRKVKTYFRGMDQDKDGVITRKDHELLADRYRDISGATTLREEQVRRKILRLWDIYFDEYSKDVSMTSEVFAKIIANLDREIILKTTTQFGDILFDLFDINGNGAVSKEEFRTLHKLFFLNDETADAAFKVLDKDNKGILNYDLFIEAINHYFNPDCVEETPDTVILGPLAD